MAGSEIELDHTLLDQFLYRVLELHKAGAMTDSLAVAAIAEVVALAANDEPNLNIHMKDVLERAAKGDL